VGEVRQPGFAVDPDRRIAYVIPSSTLAAEVDLRSGAIAYHTIGGASARQLARSEKMFNGTIRYARWLGNGRIAVAGTRFATRPRQTTTPAGVALLDTSTWHMQMLDARAGGFVSDGTWILALEPHGVEGFAADGTHRFTFETEEAIAYAQVFDGLGYIWTERSVRVIDPATGDIATLPRPQLYLIGPG
jgi:hypothetical protein